MIEVRADRLANSFESPVTAEPARQSTDADLDKWCDIFVHRRATYIVVDGWTGLFARERVARALSDGFLVHDEATSERHSDEQYTAIAYRPTDALRSIIKGLGK